MGELLMSLISYTCASSARLLSAAHFDSGLFSILLQIKAGVVAKSVIKENREEQHLTSSPREQLTTEQVSQISFIFIQQCPFIFWFLYGC